MEVGRASLKRNYSGKSSARRARGTAYAVSVYCNAAKAAAMCVAEHHLRGRHVIVGLDAACGRFGDLLKWKNTFPTLRMLHAFDGEPRQVAEACRRVQSRRYPFGVDLFVADFNADRDCGLWHERLHKQCDVVTCFFALHYAQDMRSTVQRLVECVRPGGMVLLTVLDEDALRAPLAGALRTWANGLARVQFAEHDDSRYKFTLDGVLTDSEEAVIPADALRCALSDSGCSSVSVFTVDDMVHHDLPACADVRRHTIDRLRHPLSVAERDVLGLFRVVLASVPCAVAAEASDHARNSCDIPVSPTAGADAKDC